MEVGVWGRSPHEARRRRENFSGFYRFRHGETARNGMKPKRNLWQFKPPGLLGLDLEASARDRRLRLCGHTILKQSGLQKLAQAAVACGWREACTANTRAQCTAQLNPENSANAHSCFCPFSAASPLFVMCGKRSCCGCCALYMYSQQHHLRASHQAQAVKARLKTGGCKNEVRHC